MTEAQQRRFYFPNWNGCAVANGWMMTRGRLRADLAAQREEYAPWPDPAKELYLKVVTTAEQLALAAHRSVTADDLRRGCNYVATGKISSGDLDNKQTNRVVTLFKLLADPDDLEAVMNWMHPERQENASFDSFLLKRANEAAIISISSNAFGTKHWRDLPIEKKRWIAKTVKERQPSRKTFYRRQLAAVELHSSGKQFDPANAAY
ncbi:MAG TPA: hypothetical protein VHX90_01205 [Verrucomicrobiae bacterium]|jgi:hypothetical protein|nr:hypothetical protein [Verrucomicrobiae bacterium]